MNKLKLLALAFLIMSTHVFGDPVIDKLDKLSYTVQTPTCEGSAFVIYSGSDYNLLLTCGHVVEDAVTAGQQKYGIKIMKRRVENGEEAGSEVIYTTLEKYSSFSECDVAILRTKAKISSDHIIFSTKVPDVNTPVYHMGSYLGSMGSNSFAIGIVSAIGRMVEGRVFDQVSCSFFPGSSGGAVTLKTGQCIGIADMRAGETFGLIIPSRRILEWAKKSNCDGAFDAGDGKQVEIHDDDANGSPFNFLDLLFQTK